MVEITDNDVIELFQKLDTVRDLANAISDTLQECDRLLSRTVMHFNINIKAEIPIELNHIVRVECDELRVKRSSSSYVFVKGALRHWFPDSSRPSIYFSYITLRDAIALAMYEKLEGLVTRLTEEVLKMDEKLRNRTEILKKIVETVEHVAQQHQVV